MPIITLKNGAQGHYVDKKYKDTPTNRKLGRVGYVYQKFVITKGASYIPRK